MYLMQITFFSEKQARRHLNNTCPELDVVADDELDDLKTAGNGRQCLLLPTPKGSCLWDDISAASLAQRPGCITDSLSREMVIYHSPTDCCRAALQFNWAPELCYTSPRGPIPYLLVVHSTVFFLAINRI
jgi:hypothetical protein